MKVAKFASDGGHFWTKDGQLVEQVMKADGKGYTKTTLAHARKLNLGPGVTSIIREAAAPQLVEWQINQAILCALTLPRSDSETEFDYLKRVREDAKQTAAKAAEEGSRMDAVVSEWINSGIMAVSTDGDLTLLRAVEEKIGALDCDTWKAQVACTNPLGYGTKADLVGYRKGEPVWLLDMKSKDEKGEKFVNLALYKTHHMQLAATEKALGASLRCGILFISRSDFSLARIVEASSDDMDKGWRLFKHLLAYWQTDRSYKPDWGTP